MSKTLLSFILLLFIAIGSAQETKVSTIEINGTKRLKTSFIKRLINTKSGQILDSLGLEKDVTRLKRLPAVSNAKYQVSEANNGEVDIVINIEENFTLIPYANLFSSSNDDFAFRIGLQEFNLLGKNINIGAFYQFDVFSSYGLNLRAPYLFSNKLGLSLSYNDFETQEPIFFNNTTADYKYGNQGLELMGLYEIDFKNRLELGFSLFNEKYKYLAGATQEDIPQSLNVKKHLFKLIYNFEDIQYHYQYLNGFRSTLNFQYVGSSDENLRKFLIGFNDFVFYKRIGNRGNWANRFRLGLASNFETPFAPFSVDNNLNIRGVGNTIDRGTAAIVFNTEYRHTLIDKDWFVLQSNVFIDGGSWRLAGGDFSDFTDEGNLRVYPGVGLRFMHKRIFNAIFRIDYGYGVTKNGSNGIVFGIGQYF
ncbi:POTRA domain-containing protein [Maribacter sp. HTCC2170]|uniref:POTRA domain-containing protein n=1 Tax=Maribacter sp. (strain HTCC2170 / KCCM 42371) TaxID=313603 RepID=UPI00006AE5E8|nr:POTRA domain-containing protein [Maribacter sp. HTCC2170]EAR00503.1 outer membrane surface antigen protein [Maribacter sp. HTCC2170]